MIDYEKLDTLKFKEFFVKSIDLIIIVLWI